jgi:hypothetical protein
MPIPRYGPFFDQKIRDMVSRENRATIFGASRDEIDR